MWCMTWRSPVRHVLYQWRGGRRNTMRWMAWRAPVHLSRKTRTINEGSKCTMMTNDDAASEMFQNLPPSF